MHEADFAFFDARTEAELPVGEVVRRPVLFRLAVHKSAWATGRWRRIGKAPLTPELSVPVPTFVQDGLRPQRFEIYVGGEVRPAGRQEVEGLERCAVWEPEHVEDRLRDHYAGVAQQMGGVASPSVIQTHERQGV